MSDRWFDDLPEHDPDDPEAVERALRRQERAARRHDSGKGRGPSLRPSRVGRPRRERSGGSGGNGPHKGRIAVVAAGAVGLILVLWFLLALFQPFKGDGSGESFPVNVPSGDSVGQIGDLLADKGVISNATLFEVRATLSGKRGALNHGVHQFKKDMSYSAAIEELTKTTSKKTITITIPEGLSRSEAADVIKDAGLPGDYMAATVKVPGFNPNDYGAQGRAKNLEGFLFPATYELKPTADVEDLVAEQLQAFKDNIAGVNMKYAKSKNLTVYDVLTIASMIEREVSVAKERKLVSAVIYNRLKMGEPLGIDATTRFALDNWTEPLTESDLAVDSPYNTRTNQGLPPGPIGSPGLASMEAAAHPAKSDVWLYVVKPGGCGEHVFSSSLEEHNRNVEKYQEAQSEAGGSPTGC
ncbi:MAG: endolytic transglycosylase MltG [Solirubrobacterales bacterium]|nr:endolytic transglycosylase MltG [Solirubrobacterales bacterium]